MSDSSPADPYQNFRELLDKNYQFPAVYIHKFIGKNSDLFKNSVKEFEKKFIGLKQTQANPSASGKHLALTYEYHAANAQDVVELTTATSKINDLIYIL